MWSDERLDGNSKENSDWFPTLVMMTFSWNLLKAAFRVSEKKEITFSVTSMGLLFGRDEKINLFVEHFMFVTSICFENCWKLLIHILINHVFSAKLETLYSIKLYYCLISSMALHVMTADISVCIAGGGHSPPRINWNPRGNGLRSEWVTANRNAPGTGNLTYNLT